MISYRIYQNKRVQLQTCSLSLTAKERYNGPMEQLLQVRYATAVQMVTEYLRMKTAIFTKATLLMIISTVTASLFSKIPTKATKGNGWTTTNMDLEKKLCVTALHTKATSWKTRSKEWGDTCGQTHPCTKAYGTIMKWAVTVNLQQLTIVDIMANINTVNFMARARTIGQMVALSKVSILMITRMALAFSHGRKAGNFKDTSAKVSKKVSVATQT